MHVHAYICVCIFFVFILFSWIIFPFCNTLLSPAACIFQLIAARHWLQTLRGGRWYKHTASRPCKYYNIKFRLGFGFFVGFFWVWIFIFLSSRSYLDHRLKLQPLAAALSVLPSSLQFLPCSPALSSPSPMFASQKPCPAASMLSLVRWQPQQDGKHSQVITQLFSAQLDRKRIARPSSRELLAFAAESSGLRQNPIPASTASCAQPPLSPRGQAIPCFDRL